MKKDTKIISFVLLVLLMLQVILPVVSHIEVTTSYAESTDAEEAVNYSYHDATLTITGSGTISNSWQSDPELSQYVTSVKNIVFSSNELTKIGDYAFDGCSNLTTLTVPASITSIGNYSFRNCTSLKTVTFAKSSSVISIGDYAFYGDTALSNIVGDGKNNTLPEALGIIGNYAFSGCTELKTLIYEDNLTKLGDFAFYGCAELTEFTDKTEGGMAHLNSNISVIGKDVFANTKIRNIRILNKNAIISDNAFSRNQYSMLF